MVPAGQELFRLIRRGRLEWRAEVAAADLPRLRHGQKVLVTPVGAEAIEGHLRMLAPAIDTQTRNGLAYVHLPDSPGVRAGMFARGEFELGRAPALTLPQSAVVLRDGFAYVFRLEGDGEQARVAQAKVATGRRLGERIEIVSGLDAQVRVVATGGGFLADGDPVRVVAAAAK